MLRGFRRPGALGARALLASGVLATAPALANGRFAAADQLVEPGTAIALTVSGTRPDLCAAHGPKCPTALGRRRCAEVRRFEMTRNRERDRQGVATRSEEHTPELQSPYVI